MASPADPVALPVVFTPERDEQDARSLGLVIEQLRESGCQSVELARPLCSPGVDPQEPRSGVRADPVLNASGQGNARGFWRYLGAGHDRQGVVIEIEALIESSAAIETRARHEGGRAIARERKRLGNRGMPAGEKAAAVVRDPVHPRRASGQQGRCGRGFPDARRGGPGEERALVAEGADRASFLGGATEAAEAISRQPIDRDQHEIGATGPLGAAGKQAEGAEENGEADHRATPLEIETWGSHGAPPCRRTRGTTGGPATDGAPEAAKIAVAGGMPVAEKKPAADRVPAAAKGEPAADRESCQMGGDLEFGHAGGIANQTCDVPIMISALHSVLIDVRDFEAAVRDYSRLLGADPHRFESNVERGTHSAMFRLANTTLEVRGRRDAVGSPSEVESEPHASGFGQAGLRFLCDDEDPGSVFGARGVELAPGRQEEASVEGTLGSRRWCSHRIDPASSRGLPVELVSQELAPDFAPPTAGSLLASSDPEARVRALDHVVVLSPDVEVTRAFYAEGLGLRLALDRSFEKRGVRLLFFRVGGTTIEIGSRIAEEARPGRPDRFGGLAWQVIDIEAIRARLVSDAFDVSEIRAGNKPGTRVCTVRDPVHGVPTLLIEPVA